MSKAVGSHIPQGLFQFIGMTHRHKVTPSIRIHPMSRDRPSSLIMTSPPRKMVLPLFFFHSKICKQLGQVQGFGLLPCKGHVTHGG